MVEIEFEMIWSSFIMFYKKIVIIRYLMNGTFFVDPIHDFVMQDVYNNKQTFLSIIGPFTYSTFSLV